MVPNLEFLIKKICPCKNDHEKLSKTKVGEHILCVYSMSMLRYEDLIYRK